MAFRGIALALVSYSVFSIVESARSPAGTWFIDHGWPICYLEREVTAGDSLSRLSILSGVREFRLSSLVANITTAIVLTLCGVFCWTLHLRRNRRAFHVSLLELFVVVSIAATVASVLAKRRSDVQECETTLIKLTERGWDVYSGPVEMPWFIRPIRDLGWTTDDEWSTYELSFSTDVADEYIADSVRSVLSDDSGSAMLPSVIAVSVFDDQFTDAGLRFLLRSVPNCRTLEIESASITNNGIKDLTQLLPNLRSLLIDVRSISNEGLSLLSQADELTELVIRDLGTFHHDRILAKQLPPKLKTLQVPNHWVLSEITTHELNSRGVLIMRSDPP